MPAAWRSRMCRSIVSIITGLTPAVGSSSSTSFGAAHQHGGELQQLALPVGQLAPRAVGDVREPELLQQLAGPLAGRPGSPAAEQLRTTVAGRDDEVLLHGQLGKTRACWKVRDRPRR